MVASTVVTTLKQGQELPSNAEISMMVRDPMEWLNSYKVGNDYRHPSDRELNTANFTIGSNASSDATQVWLMGDGSGDAFPSIQNQVNVNSSSTALRLENMEAEDIKSISSPFLYPITSQADSNSGISISLKEATGTTEGLVPDASALEAMLDVSPIQLLGSSETTGQITWSFNSANEAFDYLAVGETLTLTYTLTLSDGVNVAAPQTPMTLSSISLAPMTLPASRVDDTATLTETDAALATSGSLTITDIDRTNVVNVSRTLEVSQTSTSALTTVDGVTVPSDPSASSYDQLLNMLTLDANPILDATEQSDTLTWSFNSNVAELAHNQTFDYLDYSENLVLIYTVTATDALGQIATETITITIDGGNETPQISNGADTASLTESDTTLSSSGDFNVSDANTANTVAATVSDVQLTGSFTTSRQHTPNRTQ